MRRLTVCLAALAGCSRTPPPASAPAPAVLQITVVKPERRAIRRVVEQPGAVQAFEETTLLAKLAGYVGAVAADPDKKDRPPHDRAIDIGSRVKRGQVLAELFIPELDKEWEQKRAAVRQAEAEVGQAEKALAAAVEGVAAVKAAVAEAEAGVAKSQALYARWESEAGRISGLVKSGVVDAQARDETLNQFRAAEAGRAEAVARSASAAAAVKKAEADREKSAADVDAAEARRDVAQAEVGRVEALRATPGSPPRSTGSSPAGAATPATSSPRTARSRCSGWPGSTRSGWSSRCRRPTPGWSPPGCRWRCRSRR